jgi:hypothetical protein
MKSKCKSSSNARDLWKQSHDRCMIPGCHRSFRHGDVLDCHEIIGASDRSKTVSMPAFWLLCCRTHHEEFPSRPAQDSLVRQLAIKLWADPDAFNIDVVVNLWRPKATMELVEDIVAAVQKEYRAIVKEFG